MDKTSISVLAGSATSNIDIFIEELGAAPTRGGYVTAIETFARAASLLNAAPLY
jgi:hypothetical protein